MTVELDTRARLAQLEATISAGLQTFIEVGQALLEIRDDRLYRETHQTFEAYCRERWQMRREIADRYVRAAQVVETINPMGLTAPANERQARELAPLLGQPELLRDTWAEVTAGNSPLTAERVREAVDQHLPVQRDPETERRPTFNRVNDNIGWARWSWNPVTGCLHNCDYCYARDIAERFYPQKFEPTFLPERLSAPANTRPPKSADPDDPAWRRVFTCSMADLFGKWVPQEWINAVFAAILDAPQWEFLCLTKFPQRLAELDWPDNVWAGTTVDRQHRVAVAERAFRGVTAGVKWLSCEPLLEPLRFESLAMFDWVVIGASTGSTLAEPFAPPFEWVVDLYQQARDAGCRVYLKHNLFGSNDGHTPGMTPVREWPR